MTQSEIDVYDEIASQTISDPYVQRRFFDKNTEKTTGKELNMVLRLHIFFAVEVNTRTATYPKESHTIPIAASAIT